MTAVDYLRAALDELDAEASELQLRLEEIAGLRRGVQSLLDGRVPVATIPAASAAPKPAASKTSPVKPATGRRRLHDLATVARLAVEAQAADVSMRGRVADALGVSGGHAQKLIQRARKAGHDIPHGTPGRPRTPKQRPAPADRPKSLWAPKPGENVLVCADCGHVEPITGATALNRHCLATHRRAATVDERIPTPWKEPA